MVEANMLHFVRENAFDLIISMFSSFGYFDDVEEDLNVLVNAYRSLKRGGKIVLDVRGKEVHAMANVSSFSQQMANGDLIVHRTEVDDGWRRTLSEWVHIRGHYAQKFQMSFNLYSAVELTSLLEQAGFSSVRVYGDLHASPYNQQAKRLVVLAEKN